VTKENRRISSTYTLHLTYTNGSGFELHTEKLGRAWGGRKVTISARGESPGRSELFLHGNFSGIDYEFRPMVKDKKIKNQWSLTMDLPPGGLLQLTIMMETDENRYWDPAGYRRVLIDPPVINKLRLYSYIPNGDFNNWINDLDGIESMGFNGIHLLPLTQMGYTRSPYAAKNLFKIDPAWGDPKDFDRFIKECEKRKIALCVDVVLNHISSDSELARTKAHWIKGDPTRQDGLKRAGCWHQNSWISWEELALIDYDHPDRTIRTEIWNYMKDYLLYWAKLVHGTGGFIRLDNLHSSHKGFIEWVLMELHRELPGTAVFSEYFGSPEELSKGVSRWGLNLLLGNSWEYPFVPQLENYLKLVHFHSDLKYLLMPTTHDTESVTDLFGSPDSIIPRYCACALMGTGQVGITMGSEWGEPDKINFINIEGPVSFNPVNDYHGSITKINSLMEKDNIFRQNGNGEFLKAPCDSLLIFRRWSEDHKREVLVLANFDISINHEYYYHGKFQILLAERAQVNMRDEGTLINMEPCGVVVLEMLKNGE
jgi:hypothetical protein